MLSNKEKEYVKEVLKLIPEKDLHLLALVVTNNMIIPVTAEGKLNVRTYQHATVQIFITTAKEGS
jgi:hypothetical protein